MEPACALERLHEIDVTRFRQRDRAAFPVVEDLRRTLIRACFDKVNTESSFAAHDIRGIDTELAHLGDECVGDRVVRRNHCDIPSRNAIGRDRNGDVRLASSEGRHELRRLQEALEPWRVQAQHDFPERNDWFCHGKSRFYQAALVH